MLTISVIVPQIMVGFSTGMLIFLLAIGLTLIFGVAKIVNFAHGLFYTLAAFLFFTLANRLRSVTGSFWLALLVIPLIVALIAGLMERFLIRPIYKREPIEQILLTYGLAIIISNLVLIIWGGAELSISTPDILSGGSFVLGFYFPNYRLFLILVGLLIALSVWFLINKTMIGSVIRASASNSEMANALGINVPLVLSGTFMFGSFLAGLGGVLVGPLEAIWWGMGIQAVILAFIVVVIGGGGTIGGCLLAALLIGIVESVGILFLPRYSLLFIYILMILVLIFRPWGLLGKPIR